jgi:formylglycine-generating enzyme required for sulfatase activity
MFRLNVITYILILLHFTLSAEYLSAQTTGSLYVTSTPEAGMTIYINNINTGKTTPAQIDNITEGVAIVKLTHPWYRSQERRVDVTANSNQTVNFEMIQSFATLTVNTTRDAKIYVDGAIKGTTTWSGRVAEGVRHVKVEKDGFLPREHQVTIVRNRDVVIDLMLRQKTGTIEVITDPPQAMISLDGRMHGLSPKTITDLPFGTYTLTIEKPEYTNVIMRILVNDVKTQKIEVTLLSGKEITISSNVVGAKVFINQKLEGTTPLSLWLKYGTHVVKLEKDDATIVETIDVSHSGKKEFVFTLSSTFDPFANQMVFVKGGSFRMGDTFGDGNKEEKPVHPVTVNDFYISKFEVTQQQWQLIMGDNPSHFKNCPNCPVERISWFEVQDFLVKLNELTGKNYRLPSEAEWEYAAKGGSQGKGFKYSGRNNINFVSWYSGNSGNKTNPVGLKEPNELGIYDMSGNVWEWVNDWFGFYTDSPKNNPIGPDSGDFKIVKGGSWFGYIGGSRVACRGSDDPSNKRSYIGFRIALSP